MMSAEELLASLDPDQRRVAEQVKGPLCVRAGAGTGKTRAITYRIAYGVSQGVFEPTQVLAVTFTSRAAAEMRGRLRDLGVKDVQARTFHSAALRQLSFFWSSVVGGRIPPLMEHKASIVAAACSRLGLATDRASIRDYASEIEWAKVSMISPEDYVQQIRKRSRALPPQTNAETISRLLTMYEEAKMERGVLDFEDVLLLTVGMLRERDDIAAQIRRQYRHFVVDEYQDISPLQQALLDEWLGGRNNVCVVGDVAQTIYSFAGAKADYLNNFASRYPGTNVVELVRDYRSTPQIVAIANQIMAKSREQSGPTSSGPVRLVAQQPPGPEVRFAGYSDDQAEAEAVAEQIKEFVGQGIDMSSMAVLFRINAQSQAFEQSLAKAGIGYIVRGGQRFFQREEIRKARTLLQAASKTADVPGILHVVQDTVGSLGWTPEAPDGMGAVRDRWDNLNALVNLAKERSELGIDLVTFVAELDERAEAQHVPVIDGVTLSSLHAAKGLEWDVVFLVGVSDGLIPISQAETAEEIEEERRLLYVGITRAKTHLMMSYGMSRGEGRRASRRRCRFLTGIWPQGNVPTKSPKQGAKQRAKEFTQNQMPEVVELFGQLRTWRSRVAKNLGKPAFVILDDACLREIAIAQPRNLVELRAIRGVGDIKLQQYGPGVLLVLQGQDPHEAAEIVS